jgi:hypothetical protein
MPARKPATKKVTEVPATKSSKKSPEKKSEELVGELSWPQVAFHTDDGGEPITLSCGAKLQKAAMQWRSIVRNRRRWADAKQTRDEKDQTAYAQLLMLGLGEKELQRIAAARIIEVAIPFEGETLGWEARIIPWEYLLSAATRKIRPTGRLTVVRYLKRRQRATEARKPASVLYVESAPGRLSNEYNFSTERRLVQSSLDPLKFQLFKNPAARLLEDTIAKENPDVIHLAGFDAHQWTNLFSQEPAEVRDGYLMAGERNDIEIVAAEDLARMLTAGKTKPLFVGCNIYNSASRICALAVAEGVGAAIGFQDEFDDSLSELFFGTFYQTWRSEWKLLESFQAACQVLRDQPANLNGTGVVLWSDRSLLPEQAAEQKRKARRTKAVSFTYPPAAAPSAQAMRLSTEKEQLLSPADRSQAAEMLQVETEALPECNYSALHNNRPLFRTFKINKYKPGRAEQIGVDVTLYVGEQSATYSATFDLKESLLDLRDKIRVPLLHAAWADLAECVRTSLAVKVTWGEFKIYSQTFTVTLLPLDQWRDDDVDRIWLPSFVLPRDPAVRRIVDSAQRYLMALRDDSGAGFDGYQSFDELQIKQPETAAEAVDNQVRALWATLVYDSNIAYINPPPTYSTASQRLRRPSEVIEGGRGTCIDTTLLLASCLEYIEIYPVIFLLSGHAFVGYWRYDKYREEFKELVEGSRMGNTNADAALINLGEEAGSREVPRYAWYFEKKRDPDLYELIVQKVREQKLVPLESTWLTCRGAFFEAMDEGAKNLQSVADFDAMLDIYESRGKVTPIPLRGR